MKNYCECLALERNNPVHYVCVCVCVCHAEHLSALSNSLSPLSPTHSVLNAPFLSPRIPRCLILNQTQSFAAAASVSTASVATKRMAIC